MTLLQGASCQNYKLPATAYADDAIVQLPGCQRMVHDGKVAQEQGVTCKDYPEKPWKQADDDDHNESFAEHESSHQRESSYQHQSSNSNRKPSQFNFYNSHIEHSGSGGHHTFSGHTVMHSQGCQKVVDHQGNILVQNGPSCGGNSKITSLGKQHGLAHYVAYGEGGKCAAFHSPDGSKVIACPDCTRVINPVGKTIVSVGPGCKKTSNTNYKDTHQEKEEEEDEDWKDSDDWDDDEWDDDEFEWKKGDKKHSGSKSSTNSKHYEVRNNFDSW